MARQMTIENANRTRSAVVSGCRNAYGEFTVTFYLHGVRQRAADYHTEDRDDAIGTAEHWVKVETPPLTLEQELAVSEMHAGNQAVGLHRHPLDASTGPVNVGAGVQAPVMTQVEMRDEFQDLFDAPVECPQA